MQVNSDCRQLARSRQFSSVHLDYSQNSIDLVDYLAVETAERISQMGTFSLPSLGACIRNLTVATSQNILAQRSCIQNIDLDGESVDAEIQDQQPKLQLANEDLNGVYLSKVKYILHHRQTLLHLEYLDWGDECHLEPSFYNTLAVSSVRHLKLYHPLVDYDFEIKSPDTDPLRSWPLRTLHMEWGFNVFDDDASTVLLTASILRLCAPTLETLIWSNLDRRLKQTFAPGPIPTFSSLRHLRLDRNVSRALADQTILKALLKSKLISLRIGPEDEFVHALESRGCIPSLKTLVINDPPIKFLKVNPQLSKIDLGPYNVGNISAEQLEVALLPLLVDFSHLTSLRITWPETCSSLPTEGLQLVGKLKNLEQLSIGCGQRISWRRDWVVDHDELRRELSVLPRLKRLALQGDTYLVDVSRLPIQIADPRTYYQDTYATLEDIGYGDLTIAQIPRDQITPFVDSAAGKPFWEKRHARKMIGEAEKYLDVLPGLDWMYMGQRAISIELDHLMIKHVVSTTQIESDFRFFLEMFGDGPCT